MPLKLSYNHKFTTWSEAAVSQEPIIIADSEDLVSLDTCESATVFIPENLAPLLGGNPGSTSLLAFLSMPKLWQQSRVYLPQGTLLGEIPEAGILSELLYELAGKTEIQTKVTSKLPGDLDTSLPHLSDRGTYSRSLVPLIRSLPVSSDADSQAILAGLLLWNEADDESHRVSQNHEGNGRNAAADYWHAIMHRREQDYGNSGYWFRRVGNHPVFNQLSSVVPNAAEFAQCSAEHVREFSTRWDPFEFNTLCRRIDSDTESPLHVFARVMQHYEMRLLIEQTIQDAGWLDA